MTGKLEIVQSNIKNLFKNLNENLKPECVILYGSFARGDFNERSDIDIIVISSKLPKNFYERLILLYELIEAKEAIDMFGYTPNEFTHMLEKRHCTSLFAMDEGVPLFGKNYFNDLKEIYNQITKKFQLTKTSSAWVPKLID